MAGATLSAGPGLAAPCAGTVTYDVWYKFTAVTAPANTISLSSLGTNFTSSGIQVFSGSCGSCLHPSSVLWNERGNSCFDNWHRLLYQGIFYSRIGP